MSEQVSGVRGCQDRDLSVWTRWDLEVDFMDAVVHAVHFVQPLHSVS
jgi:hypothetical protein